MSVTYLLPTAPPIATRDYGLSLDTTRPSLRVGLLSNGFPDTENFLARQAQALAALMPDASFRIEAKGADTHLSAVVPEPLLSDMAADCDAVVIAWGHCGSCTAGVTRDAIAFAGKGVPSATLICDVFWDYSAWMAKAMGMPDIPRVRIPYPVAGAGEAIQRSVAEAAAGRILSGWRG